MAKLRIKLIKSLIGSKDNQIATIKALGLKKIRDIVEQEDNAQVRGMVNKISHLVEVTEI